MKDISYFRDSKHKIQNRFTLRKMLLKKPMKPNLEGAYHLLQNFKNEYWTLHNIRETSILPTEKRNL